MILPKISAAILSMNVLGSAYAASQLNQHISLEQWVVISGATNGAATLFGVSLADLRQHRHTAQTHLTRYAVEYGIPLDEFDPLFERGMTEGKMLIVSHKRLIVLGINDLIAGFQHDKSIDYQHVKLALRA